MALVLHLNVMVSPGLLTLAVLAGERRGLGIAAAVSTRELAAVGSPLELRAWALAAMGLGIAHSATPATH